MQWLLTGRGICGSNHFDTIACVRSSADEPYPDLQLTISPIAMDDLSWEPMQERPHPDSHSQPQAEPQHSLSPSPPPCTCTFTLPWRTVQEHAFQLHVGLMRAHSLAAS